MLDRDRHCQAFFRLKQSNLSCECSRTPVVSLRESAALYGVKTAYMCSIGQLQSCDSGRPLSKCEKRRSSTGRYLHAPC